MATNRRYVTVDVTDPVLPPSVVTATGLAKLTDIPAPVDPVDISQLALKSELPDVSAFITADDVPGLIVPLPGAMAFKGGWIGEAYAVGSVVAFMETLFYCKLATELPVMLAPYEDTDHWVRLSCDPFVAPADDGQILFRNSGYPGGFRWGNLPTPADLTGYARTTDIPDVSAFITTDDLPAPVDLTGYAHTTDIPTPVDLTPYVKTIDLPAPVDLTTYALKTELPDVTGFATIAVVEDLAATVAALPTTGGSGIAPAHLGDLVSFALAGGDTHPVDIISSAASSVIDGSATNQASNAFDGDPATYWHSALDLPHWISGHSAGAEVLVSCSITIYTFSAGRSPRNFKIQGSNDGSTWVDLSTHTGVLWTIGQTQTFTVNGTLAYTDFRIYITASDGGYQTMTTVLFTAASGGPAVLPVGAEGEVLTVDPTTPAGLKWATPEITSLSSVSIPTSSADALGVVGDIASDDGFIYSKTSTGWKRAALTAW